MQAAEWHASLSPRPKISHLVKPKEKVMLIVFFFFDIEGVVHHEFVLRGQTVNGHCYMQVSPRLRDAVRWKRCESGGESGFCITMTHRATHRLLRRNSLHREHSASPNHLSLQISLLFSTLKMCLKGTRFAIVQHIKSNATTELRKILNSLPLVLPAMAESMKQVFVRARVLL